MRAVVYARFSTDQQSASSIDDQASVCRARAAALGLSVAAVYSDAATSGQSLVGDRPGGRALLADAFDVLLIESLDRLSRDSVESERIVRRLEHRGVRIVCTADGYDTATGKGRTAFRMFRSVINEQYVEDLREKTLRGMHGQFARGYHLTGLSYGYRSIVAGVDARGEPIGHRLEIVPAQAEVVREILARYAAGESCQRIAYDLNARGVRAPRGKTWCVSALYGSPAKGSGILNNDLYAGRYIWNRSRWIKDPDTRKRQRFERPREEWRIEELPALRIVDDATWCAVRERMDRTRNEGGRKGRGGVPTTLFGGLLRCGLCGGALVKLSARSYGCAAARDRGPAVCAGVSVRQQATDDTLLRHVEKELRAPHTVAVLEQKTAALLATRAQSEDVGAIAARVRELEGDVGRLVDAIASIGASPALADRLRSTEAGLAAARIAQARAAVPTLPVQARRLVRALLDRLASGLHGDLPAARDALRLTFGDIVIRPEADGTFAEFEDTAGRMLRAAVNGSGCGGVLPDPVTRVRLRIGP